MHKTVKYDYSFEFPDGKKWEYSVALDASTLSLAPPPAAAGAPPEWARLDFHKCEICPLDGKTHPHCPAASAVAGLIEFFKDRISFEDVSVTIAGETRNYFKKTKLQEAVGSLLGLLMATSGCPALEKLKPMTALHLPFARANETVYRVLSMYLLSQYFVARRGGKPDWEMKNLSKIYADVRTVNKSFSRRISAVIEKDAGVNALVVLDCFALATAMTIDNKLVEKMEGLFGAYLK